MRVKDGMAGTYDFFAKKGFGFRGVVLSEEEVGK
jgi:hypothetical protein